MLKSSEIRRGFIDFFQDRGHTFVPSSPVVPIGDPTLLFTNAGMNQFKDIFLGLRQPSYTRAANSQKCIRVSGKHNDLEEVGRSNRHHTFFEMLGNWSFGDYYKREAVRWAWELFTEVWKLPKDKLYATVYIEDDEAEECWKSETDIGHDRISRSGKKDNFWEMGEIGPCGPCSEIHIDLGPQACGWKDIEHECEVNGECGRFVELWNLVFMQYSRDKDGRLTDLPATHVDTGAGLERIAMVTQGGLSNYDSDLFKPLIAGIVELSGAEYGEIQIPHRVIADHLRALVFAFADGALPSNEGRGYVLRRILRRAARFGHEIGLKKPFIYKLAPILIDTMGDFYPEIRDKHQHITLAVKSEEEGFSATLERGIDIFETVADKVKSSGDNVIPGEEAFKLYDTFGFPLDLTQLMAREKGLEVDVDGFLEAMEGQRNRAREGGKFEMEVDKNLDVVPLNLDLLNKPLEEWDKFNDKKYECETEAVELRKYDSYFTVSGVNIPFYAESGGQVGDIGTIATGSNPDIEFNVVDTYFDKSGKRVLKVVGDYEYFKRDVEKNHEIIVKVDKERRMNIRRNHTATHLLQYALRKHLGKHVHQAGSLVHPDYLRFDYTHYHKPDADTLLKIEREVNELILRNDEVSAQITTFDQARESGAIALFGEKYGGQVRMISVGDISRELCGGAHVNRSGDIGYFRITSETGVSSGVRRIEAVTGFKALDEVMNEHKAVENFKEILYSRGSDVTEKLKKFVEEKKEIEKEVERLRRSGGGIDIAGLLKDSEELNGAKIISRRVEAKDMEALKALGDVVRDNLKSGIAFLGAEMEDKAAIVCVVTDDLIKRGIKAGDIVGKTAKSVGGGGGGRPHLATAGMKDKSKLDSALQNGKEIAAEALA